MQAASRITEIVSGVQAAVALPEFDKLDAQSLRRVKREAAERGVSPATYWHEVRLSAAADLTADADARAIALAARR